MPLDGACITHVEVSFAMVFVVFSSPFFAASAICSSLHVHCFDLWTKKFRHFY